MTNLSDEGFDPEASLHPASSLMQSYSYANLIAVKEEEHRSVWGRGGI